MSVFANDYVSYYDLFYAEKDYEAEAAFVRGIIERHKPNAHSLLDLGCGNARHAVEFARAGVSVTGVDRSADMLATGRDRIAQLSPDLRSRITLVQGDVTEYRDHAVYDAVIALFHVVSYQTANESLQGIFNTARAATIAGGLFVFDFWYGPAVITERPEVRVKRVARSGVQVTRVAEPDHLVNRNVVDVQYTLFAIDQETGFAKQTTELHSMRYLFLPEIEFLAEQAGFHVIEAGEWLSGKSLDQRCWSGYVAVRATVK
jgi:SAM-dependent methyltransferase